MARETSLWCVCCRASDATHSRVVAGGSGAGGLGGGPELRGPTAGWDLGDGRAAGGVQGAQGGVDLAGWLVVVERLADLAAGQPAGGWRRTV